MAKVFTCDLQKDFRASFALILLQTTNDGIRNFKGERQHSSQNVLFYKCNRVKN